MSVTNEVRRSELNGFLSAGVQPRHAAGVLASIESIEVKGEANTGDIGPSGRTAPGRPTGRQGAHSYGRTARAC